MQKFDTQTGTDILTAKQLLEAGEVVAIPTETVYGLAGNALSEETVLKIFSVKDRPHFDPLIVHTFSKEQIAKYVEEIPTKAQILIDRFMPGPITLLLKKKNIIPDLVTSGLDTVAIRIPNHPLALQLLRQLDFPLAAPSANPFGYISPTTAKHVNDQLGGKIPYILDGAATTVGVESTIVGFDGDKVIIYRLGGLSVENITEAIGEVEINKSLTYKPQGPGMMESHYAPTKEMWFGRLGSLTHTLVLNAASKGVDKIAVIAFDKYIDGVETSSQILLSPSGDLNEAAKNLFAVMRQLDESDAVIIYAVPFPNEGLGRAINDRLKRASL